MRAVDSHFGGLRAEAVSLSLRLCSLSSARGTFMSRRARERNRCMGVWAFELGPPRSFAAPLASDLSRSRSRRFMFSEFLVGQPLPGDRRYHLSEPTAVFVFALIETESL